MFCLLGVFFLSFKVCGLSYSSAGENAFLAINKDVLSWVLNPNPCCSERDTARNMNVYH